jgi:RNA polymerase sigma factor (sigma-70 family)
MPDGEGLTDGELLGCFIEHRDEAAFAALVRRHGPMVWGVCRRLLDHHDAEDAFQAAFLVLARKAASILPRELVANWLYGVAHQTALQARRTLARRRVRERQVTKMPEPGVIQQDFWNDLQPVLDKELSCLPDKYRVVVVLCDLEGQSRKEVARQLACPEGTVAGRLARARELLAKRLARNGISLSGGLLAMAAAQGTTSAALPAFLVVSTIQAATVGAAGQAAATGVISTKVAALTEGVLKAMLLSKLKAATMVLLTLTLLGVSGVLLTYATLRSEQPKFDKDLRSEQPKSDKEALQGTWLQVSEERNGEKLPEEKIKGGKMVFADDKVTWQGEPETRAREGTFTIDPDKKPKEIDLTFSSITLKGIYELKGNTLKVVIAERGRPTEFDSTAGGGLLVFERKK